MIRTAQPACSSRSSPDSRNSTLPQDYLRHLPVCQMRPSLPGSLNTPLLTQALQKAQPNRPRVGYQRQQPTRLLQANSDLQERRRRVQAYLGKATLLTTPTTSLHQVNKDCGRISTAWKTRSRIWAKNLPLSRRSKRNYSLRSKTSKGRSQLCPTRLPFCDTNWGYVRRSCPLSHRGLCTPPWITSTMRILRRRRLPSLTGRKSRKTVQIPGQSAMRFSHQGKPDVPGLTAERLS